MVTNGNLCLLSMIFLHIILLATTISNFKFQVSSIHQFGDIARGSGRVPDPRPEIFKKGTVKIIGGIIMVYPNS